jgi:excisionase family DNA binding protein
MTEGKYRMSETNVTQSEYVSAAEVAKILGVCRLTVYRMCQSGTLAHIRTGGTGKIYRILRTSLDQHLTPTAPREPAPGTSWAWQNPPAPVPNIPGQLQMVDPSGAAA